MGQGLSLNSTTTLVLLVLAIGAIVYEVIKRKCKDLKQKHFFMGIQLAFTAIIVLAIASYEASQQAGRIETRTDLVIGVLLLGFAIFHFVKSRVVSNDKGNLA